MEKEKIIEDSFALSDMIKKSEEYLDLKKKEKWLEEDPKVLKLLNEFNDANELLVEIRSNKNYKKLEGNVLENISKIKEKLDADPLVIAYKKAYRKYEKLIKEVDREVFNEIKESRRKMDLPIWK